MKVQLSRYKTNAIQGQRKSNTFFPNAYDNLFSNYLNSLYNNSPTHQCIIDDIAQQIVGMGLTCPNKADEVKLVEFFKKKSVLGMASALLIQESLSLEIRRNPLKEIKAVENINVSHFRVTLLDDEDCPMQFSYKADWNPKSSIYSYKNNYINSYNSEDEKSILYYYDSGTFNTPYGRPKYLSAADAIELEIAIYMMHSHGAQNGMFPSMIISKETSGNDEQDKADAIETQAQTMGASNAGKVISTYYRQGGNAPTFSTPNLTGLDKIYENQYETAEIGILKAHRIPSANLISGLNSKGAGFTSETEELAYATERMRVKIIEPRRAQLLDILKPIFAELEIEDVSFRDVEDIKIEVETQLSANKDFDDQKMLDALEVGEVINAEEWELVDVREENQESTEEWAKSLIKPVQTSLQKLAEFVTSRPNKESDLDKDYYKIRYSYQEKYSSAKSRRFCTQMMGRTGRGVVYRKEDIDKASEDGVNNQFGHNGQNYSLFRFKGGVQCGHYWQEELYRMKSKTELYISRGKEVDNIPSKKKPKGTEYRQAKKAPKDMPRNGAYPK